MPSGGRSQYETLPFTIRRVTYEKIHHDQYVFTTSSSLLVFSLLASIGFGKLPADGWWAALTGALSSPPPLSPTFSIIIRRSRLSEPLRAIWPKYCNTTISWKHRFAGLWLCVLDCVGFYGWTIKEDWDDQSANYVNLCTLLFSVKGQQQDPKW